MKNWLITLNGPKDRMGRVDRQYLSVYAATKEKAESIGWEAINHMHGYWTVWDVEPLE